MATRRRPPVKKQGGGLFGSLLDKTGIGPLFDILAPGREQRPERRALAPYGRAVGGLSEMAGTNAFIRIAQGRAKPEDYRVAASFLTMGAGGAGLRAARRMPFGAHQYWSNAMGLGVVNLGKGLDAYERYHKRRQAQFQGDR